MTGRPGSIELPDGSRIRGLRNPTPEPPLPNFGLYLGTGRFRERHEPELTWPHEWIDWPDFRLPRDRTTATDQIRALHAKTRTCQVVEVACGAGIGRTGTVIACLAILAGHRPHRSRRVDPRELPPTSGRDTGPTQMGRVLPDLIIMIY